jgi:hypothetical protein
MVEVDFDVYTLKLPERQHAVYNRTAICSIQKGKHYLHSLQPSSRLVDLQSKPSTTLKAVNHLMQEPETLLLDPNLIKNKSTQALCAWGQSASRK